MGITDWTIDEITQHDITTKKYYNNLKKKKKLPRNNKINTDTRKTKILKENIQFSYCIEHENNHT